MRLRIVCAAALLVAAPTFAQVQTATKPGTIAPNAVTIQGCHGAATGCSPVDINGTISVAGTADVVSGGAPTTFSGNAQCTGQLLLAGEQGAGFQLNPGGTLVATLTPQYSMEASGSNWTTTQFIDQNGSKSSTVGATNANVLTQLGIVLVTGARRAQVCTTAFTGGSGTGFTVAAYVQGGTASAGGGSGTSSSFGAGFPGTGTAAGAKVVNATPTLTNGNMEAPELTTAGRLIVDGSQVTQPISASSLPLPTGAATSAKQPALGTAGTPSADVLTVQGASSMTALKVDGSAVTQPVSGTVTANVGTTNGLALDATLTGGSQKAIVRGGAKGGTSAADVTSTATDANHQALDVNVNNSVTVSGTVTANVGTTNGLALDATVSGLEVAQGSTTSGQNGPLVQGAVTTAAPTYTTAKTNPLSLTTAGALRTDGSATTQPVSGTVTANAGSGTFTVSGTVTANAGSGTLATSNTSLNDDTAANASADERATTRLAETTALRAQDTTQTVGSRLVTMPGDTTNGLFVQVKNTPTVTATQATPSSLKGQVEGTQASGSTTVPNPVVIGGSDYGGTPAVQKAKVDSTGLVHVSVDAGGGTGGGPSDAAANAAASESDTARQKVTSAIRVLDTGQGAGSQLVTAKGDQTSGLWVNCKAGCSAAGDTTGAQQTINSGAAVATVALAGENSVSVQLTGSTSPVFTLFAQCSKDGGTTYGNTISFVSDTNTVASSLSNPANGNYGLILPGGCAGATTVRVSTNGAGNYTSGSIVAQLRAVAMSPPAPAYAGAVGTSSYPAQAVAIMAQDSSTATTSRAVTATANGVKVDGSAVTQPVSGTVTANVGTTNGLALDATVSALQVAQGSTTSGQKGGLVEGAVTTAAPTYTTAQTSPLSLTTAGALRTDSSGTTQPVSGTVAATQSGTWTVQPGNTANTTAWKVDGSAVTQPVSGTVTSNQGGAPWTVTGSGSAGTAATGVVTVQGIASMTALKTDGSGVTQPVSGTVTTTPPANASTNIAQVGGNSVTTLASGEQKIGVEGLAASGAAKSGNPVQVGGVFNTTQPTVTTGQAVEVQATARGAVIVATGADTFNTTVSGTVTTTPPANASTNVAQFGGTNVSTGTGAGGAGIPRVTISNDSSLAANQSVNVAQVNGVATAMGNGTTTTGTQRVTISSDSTGQIDLTDRAARLVGVVYGSQAAQLKQSATNFNTVVELAVGSGLIDPRSIRALTSSDTVTVVQGTGTNLHMVCDSGCTPGGSFGDNTAFTAGTTAINVSGGVFNDGLSAVTSGNAASPRITAQRGLHINLRDSSGNELLGQKTMAGSVPVVFPSDQSITASNPSVGTNAAIPAPSSSTQFGGRAPDGSLQPVKIQQDGTQVVNVAGGNVNVTLNSSPKVQAQDPAGRVVDFKSPGQPPTGFETAQVVAVSPLPSPICPYVAGVSQTANAVVIAGRPGFRTHVCKVFLVSAGAQSVSITEGTGATCGTGSAALAGSTTVANGVALAANGGWVEGSSSVITYTEKNLGDDVCLLQSAAGVLAGSITYTYGPY